MTKKMIVVTALAGLALAGAGCKKKTTGGEPAQGSGTAAMDGTGSAGGAMGSSGSAMGSATGSAMGSAGSAATPTADTADKLEIFAEHVDPAKPKVTVTFTGIKVVKATFDPEKIEGGTAELEVDVNTLASGVDKRDTDLKTPGYLDSAKFPKVSIKIDNVKKAGDGYTADATINAHGVEKKVPVTFTVADKTADSIRINGEAKFSRLDFGVGRPESDDGAKAAMTAKLQVTLHKS